jgi:hypothetical protein
MKSVSGPVRQVILASCSPRWNPGPYFRQLPFVEHGPQEEKAPRPRAFGAGKACKSSERRGSGGIQDGFSGSWQYGMTRPFLRLSNSYSATTRTRRSIRWQRLPLVTKRKKFTSDGRCRTRKVGRTWPCRGPVLTTALKGRSRRRDDHHQEERVPASVIHNNRRHTDDTSGGRNACFACPRPHVEYLLRGRLPCR